jgi:hypothetical protein
MLSGPSQSREGDESELTSSPWEWGVVVDDDRDTIPAPAPAEGEEDDVVLGRA